MNVYLIVAEVQVTWNYSKVNLLDRIKSDQVKRDNIGFLDNILKRYERTKDVMHMFKVQEEEMLKVQEEEEMFEVQEEASSCSCQ